MKIPITLPQAKMQFGKASQRKASLGTDSLHLAFTALTFVRRFFCV